MDHAKLLNRRWPVFTAAFILLTGYLLLSEGVPRTLETLRLLEDLERRNEKLRVARSWQNEISRITAEQRSIERTLSSSAGNPRADNSLSAMLQNLQEAADRSGIVLTSLKPGEIRFSKMHEVLPLELRLSGSFHGIGGFVERIERSQYPISVINLELASNRAEPGMLTGRLLLNVARLKKGGGQVE